MESDSRRPGSYADCVRWRMQAGVWYPNVKWEVDSHSSGHLFYFLAIVEDATFTAYIKREDLTEESVEVILRRMSNTIDEWLKG